MRITKAELGESDSNSSEVPLDLFCKKKGFELEDSDNGNESEGNKENSTPLWARLVPLSESISPKASSSTDPSICSIIELCEPKVTIGRDSSCNVVLNVVYMSYQHCTLSFDFTKKICRITDHSSNGTWVNRNKIHRRSMTLKHNDEIMLVPESTRRKRKRVAFTFMLEKPIENPEIQEKYKIIKELGTGAFGTVYLAQHRESHVDFAIKVIKKDSLWKQMAYATNREITLLDEAKILQLTSHPNIVKVHGSIEDLDHSKAYVVMDYCRGGDMLEYIQRNDSYSEIRCKKVFAQIVSAIGYLHRLSIAHRDLKPDNILLCDSHSNFVKLSDFGISCRSSSSTLCNSRIGTPLYQAPEVYQMRSRYAKNGYDGKACDLWSLGIILYIMLIAAPPSTNSLEIIQLVKSRNLHWHDEVISDHAKDLIYALLQVNPSQRITIEEVAKHSWFQGSNITFNFVGVAQTNTGFREGENDEIDLTNQTLMGLESEGVSHTQKQLDDNDSDDSIDNIDNNGVTLIGKKLVDTDVQMKNEENTSADKSENEKLRRYRFDLPHKKKRKLEQTQTHPRKNTRNSHLLFRAFTIQNFYDELFIDEPASKRVRSNHMSSGEESILE